MLNKLHFNFGFQEKYFIQELLKNEKYPISLRITVNFLQKKFYLINLLDLQFLHTCENMTDLVVALYDRL